MKKAGRHQQRIWALQILYRLDLMKEMNKQQMDKELEKFKNRQKLKEDNHYFENLVQGVIENKEQYDEFINDNAINWDLERISYVDRNILRIALFEIENDIPVGVAVNEAVEVAKEYGEKKSFVFINGILGKIEEK